MADEELTLLARKHKSLDDKLRALDDDVAEYRHYRKEGFPKTGSELVKTLDLMRQRVAAALYVAGQVQALEDIEKYGPSGGR